MIKLDDKYTLENDSNNWILHFKESKGVSEKTGKEYFAGSKWYCSSLQNAIKRYLDECLKPCETVNHLHVVLKDTMEKIEGLIIMQ